MAKRSFTLLTIGAMLALFGALEVQAGEPCCGGVRIRGYDNGGGYDNSYRVNSGYSGYRSSTRWGYNSGYNRDVGSRSYHYRVHGGGGTRTEGWDNFEGYRDEYRHHSHESYGGSSGRWRNDGYGYRPY